MFAGKDCLITGGSLGLGKALAIKLAKEGANVTILARSESGLRSAEKEIKLARKDAAVNVAWIAADVTDPKSLKSAFEKLGKTPDFVFCCAGMAKPGFFLEQPFEDHVQAIQLNYLGALNTAKLAAERMVQDGIKGRIIFVSSTLGFMGMVGYSQYAPSKWALRGLAECLRQELLPHGISIHIYFVATIQSPGYERENETKPEITKLIEGSDTSDSSPEARADTLLAGIRKNQFMITSDWATDLFRVAALGINSSNYLLKDILLLILGWLIIPIWRHYSDYQVRQSHNKHI